MKKLLCLLCACAMLLSLGLCASAATDPEPAADTVIIGSIYTGSDYVEALAIQGDVIVYAGDEAGVQAYIGENTAVTTLEDGQTVFPGFADGHAHIGNLMTATGDKSCDLSAAPNRTLDEFVEIITEYIASNPDDSVYTGKGWINSAFENGCPTADILDEICSDKPIIISSADGHSYWANTAMMELAGVTADTPQPKGGTIELDEDGNPNGCFRDTAMYILKKALPLTSKEKYKEGIAAGQELYASEGYTSYLEVVCNDTAQTLTFNLAEAYEEMDQAGELLMDVQGAVTLNNDDDALAVVDKAIAMKDETAGGSFELTTIKIYMDGVIEGATAYLSESYSHREDYYGAARWEDEESLDLLTQVIVKANEAGLTVHFHAIGDQALADAIECVQRAYEEIGQPVLDAKNAVTHLQVVPEESMEEMAELNMFAVLNPWAYKADGFYEETEVLFLGEERASEEYPMKSFLNEGVNVSFGTDFGGSVIYKSMVCYHVLTTRTDETNNPETTLNPSEDLSRTEALDAMTKGVASQLNWQDTVGTLDPGMKANLVVLSQDILTVPDDDLVSTEILRTMANGRWIYGQ